MERHQKVAELQALANQQSFHVFCSAQILDRPPVKSCHMSTISYFRPSILIPSIFKRHAPLLLFRVVSEQRIMIGISKLHFCTSIHLFSPQYLIGWMEICIIMDHIRKHGRDFSLNRGGCFEVCCKWMLCNLKRLHYQFPQCKPDGLVNAFSLQLLIIFGEMGAG